MPLFNSNNKILIKLIFVSILMFGFGYILIPMYKVLCIVTGINVITNQNNKENKVQKNTQIDRTRFITIEFDANTQDESLQFKSLKKSIIVHPGEIVHTFYEISNLTSKHISAQAIPSYAPKEAVQYFTKLECFCFKQQNLEPNENRKVPVIFVISSNVPKYLKNITLSYTFFGIGNAKKQKMGEHHNKPSKV